SLTSCCDTPNQRSDAPWSVPSRSRPPRHTLRKAVLRLAGVVAGIDMNGRGIDRPLRAETNQHAVLAAGHLLDDRPRLSGQRLSRHDLTDPDHGVDQEVEVRVEARRPVELEIGEWPFLVEHANRRLAETLDGPGLGACRHGGNE